MTTHSYNSHNSQNDLFDLISRDVVLKKVANTHGGEFAGACPFCKAGVDRLRVWPNSHKPGWWCRMCDRKGDAIDYLRAHGYSYVDACKQLGQPVERRSDAHPFVAPPVVCAVPSNQWRECAAGFVFWAQGHIEQALPYLTGRGLTEQTIRKAGLGYNPAQRECSRSKWGMDADKEYGDRFWLPQGIVIPSYADGALWRVQIRREIVRDNQDRYKTVTGSSNVLYGADSLQPSRPAVLVEGPFDALAVQQAAGDLAAVAASGTSGARHIRWITHLALASQALIALDADAAGDHAARFWLDALPRGKRWRPYYDDPAQMLQDGQDVRGWVLAGLGIQPAPWALTETPQRDYWRAEVAAQSSALARLETICRESGYDYAATVEVLK